MVSGFGSFILTRSIMPTKGSLEKCWSPEKMVLAGNVLTIYGENGSMVLGKMVLAGKRWLPEKMVVARKVTGEDGGRRRRWLA